MNTRRHSVFDRDILRSISLALALALLLPSCLTNSGQPSEPELRGSFRVLFIGNSYTYENNLPACVEAIGAEAADIDTRMIAAGGATLARHWNDGLAAEEIRGGNWDYVVLQEQSTLGRTRYVNGIALIDDPTSFHRAVGSFAALAQKHGAVPLLLATWPRKASPEQLATLHNAYTQIGRELQLAVMPVGLAWVRLMAQDPTWDLYGPDGSHPGSDGTFVTASMVVQQVLGRRIDAFSESVRVELMDGRGQPRGEFLVTELSPARRTQLSTTMSALRDECAAAGGYLDLAEDPQPQRPTPGAGEAMGLDALLGEWRGQASLLGGQPSYFKITTAGSAANLEVRLQVEHHLYGDIRKEPAESTLGSLDQDHFRFTHPTNTFGKGELRYDFALVDGELVGVVEFGDASAPFFCSDLRLKRATGRNRATASRTSKTSKTSKRAHEVSLAAFSPLLGSWGPVGDDKRIVHDYRWTVGHHAMRLREGFARGRPDESELDGILFSDPATGAVEFVSVAGSAEGQGRLFRGRYRALEDGRMERIYTVQYRNLADTPAEELGGTSRRYREVYTIAGDRLDATLEWWRDGAWKPFGMGKYSLIRRGS